MDSKKVLFFSTQTSFSEELKILLENEGMSVTLVSNRQEALLQLTNEQPLITLLNCEEHGIIDLTFCQDLLRARNGLLILLSDIENSHFQIFALNLGADASFQKSTSPKIISSNIQALARRYTTTNNSELTFGNLTVDPDRRDAFIDKSAAQLSTMEFDLLWYLVQHSGNVVSRDEIHKCIYHAEYNGYERSIDLYISRIRQKIGDPSDSPNYLKTVRGVGYKFIGRHAE